MDGSYSDNMMKHALHLQGKIKPKPSDWCGVDLLLRNSTTNNLMILFQ